MEIIGKVKLKWNGEAAMVPVTSDGCIQLPDGTMHRLREDLFEGIKEKLLITSAAPQPAEKPNDGESPAPVEQPAEHHDAEPEKAADAVVESPSASDGPVNEPVEQAKKTKADLKKERLALKEAAKRQKKVEKQKQKEEKLAVREEKAVQREKRPMSPGKAAAIAVAAVLLAEAVAVAGLEMAPKNGIRFFGPEVTTSVSESGSIPDGEDSVLIIARVKGEDGVERDIALGEFNPNH